MVENSTSARSKRLQRITGNLSGLRQGEGDAGFSVQGFWVKIIRVKVKTRRPTLAG
jgi:hypothetical protein